MNADWVRGGFGEVPHPPPANSLRDTLWLSAVSSNTPRVDCIAVKPSLSVIRDFRGDTHASSRVITPLPWIFVAHRIHRAGSVPRDLLHWDISDGCTMDDRTGIGAGAGCRFRESGPGVG